MMRLSNLTLRNALIATHDALATALALFASFYLRFEGGELFYDRVPLLLHILPFTQVHASANILGHPTPLQLSFVWSFVIAVIWLLLSVWRAMQLVASAIRLRGLVNRATPVSTDPALQALLEIRMDT